MTNPNEISPLTWQKADEILSVEFRQHGEEGEFRDGAGGGGFFRSSHRRGSPLPTIPRAGR